MSAKQILPSDPLAQYLESFDIDVRAQLLVNEINGIKMILKKIKAATLR